MDQVVCGEDRLGITNARLISTTNELLRHEAVDAARVSIMYEQARHSGLLLTLEAKLCKEPEPITGF